MQIMKKLQIALSGDILGTLPNNSSAFLFKLK